jgi:hypothetical protein
VLSTAHNHSTLLACPRCVSGCGGVCVFGSQFATSLAIRRKYILGAARTSQPKSSKLKIRLKLGFFAAQAVGELPSPIGRDNYWSLRSCRLSTCAPKPPDPNSPKERWSIAARPFDNHIRPAVKRKRPAPDASL